MIVVADSSPLIALSAIGRYELPYQLFGEILIPAAVWLELNARSTDALRAELLCAPWLIQKSPANHDLVRSLRQSLGAGEAEAIALSIELGASLIVIDERLGRRTAARFKLRSIGVLGLLLEAKARGMITEVRPLVEQLHERAGFRLSDDLIRRILSDCGES